MLRGNLLHAHLNNRPREEVEPYSALARYYDQVMDHIDYRAWAAYVHRIVKRQGRKYRNAIEYACGTGSFARQFARHGYLVTAVDGSAEMIRKAREAKPLRGVNVEYKVADLREMPLVPRQELGICLYDSLNYLMEEEDVEDFFRAARETIHEGGLLIFDLSTEHNSLSHFNGYVGEEEVKGAFYRRESRYDRDQRIQHNIFEIFPDDEEVIYLEHHRQRIWPIDWMIERAEDESFRPLTVYHDSTFRPGSEDSDRVHVVVERV